MNEMSRLAMPRGPVRLGQRRRLTVYLISAGLWASGAMWLLFHYFLRTASEFGPEPHPLEPWWLKLHGGFAFAAMWMIGLLSANHIVNGWKTSRRRWSGIAMLTASALMVLTAYLLYYSGDEATRSFVSLLHWSIGILAPALFLYHRLGSRFFARRRTAPRKTSLG